MSTTPANCTILCFDGNNRLAVRRLGAVWHTPFTGADLPATLLQLEKIFRGHTPPIPGFRLANMGRQQEIFLCQVSDTSSDPDIENLPLEQLEANPSSLAPELAALLPLLDPVLIRIPYLHLSETDFIYKFRPEKERNTSIYRQDEASLTLYQSRLCAAIKTLVRQQERSADRPVGLDFGVVTYLIPSHFGFCLGVRNAIERAYETLAENPGRRVFMLSELIHNPFVNDDLCRRGLSYLQTDKGVPMTSEGKPSRGLPGETLLWDSLTPADIVIIPAFGATDEDKKRLIRKGISVYSYDATCMLVEKVWKAAAAYGREGYTVVIHGKHEHEETKATFSNTRRHTSALIVRNLEEAKILGEIILNPDTHAAQARFDSLFRGRHTSGFEIRRHLERIALVNQTTLLSNETIEIIEYLKEIYLKRFGDPTRVGGERKRDTLCYATQVNQDGLARALEMSPDAAFVIGGTNSSNTYQLYRLCEQRLGTRAFFIQSESAIRSLDQIDHFVYHPKPGQAAGYLETRPLWSCAPTRPRILITGGASCPDGIIQQVITRINALMPKDSLRPIDEVLQELKACE